MARAPSKSALADPFVDFPDDSGAQIHPVEPVSYEDEDEVLARLIALFLPPSPRVPAYVEA